MTYPEESSAKLENRSLDRSRRRGERSALQRPRVPGWLAEALGRDAWLIDLAKAILEWVGTDATAGSSRWPLNAFAERRAGQTGNHTAGEAVVADEVEVVLTAMRGWPAWYEKYVERPFAHTSTPEYTEPLDPYERDEALLHELPSLAIEVITLRADRSENAATVVADVRGTAFGSLPASPDLESVPADAPIDDQDDLKRIAAMVLELLGNLGPGAFTW